MAEDTIIFGGIITFLMGLFGWVFKSTTTKANDAMSISTDLKRRVDGLEQKLDNLQSIRVSVAKIETKFETETSNIKNTLKRIESHIIRDDR